MFGSCIDLTALAVRRRHKPTGFTPAALNPAGWYDPSDLSTLFQDSAGMIPVTAHGDPVGLMLDKSGNGNHLTQGVAAQRPSYGTDGQRHWIEGDGIDDELSVASRLGFASNPDIRIVVGLRPLAVASGDERLVTIGDHSGTGILAAAAGTDGWSWRYNNGNVKFSQTITGTDVVATWGHAAGGNYGSSFFFLNAAQVGAIATASGLKLPSSTAARTSLFATSRAGLNGRVYGVIIGSFTLAAEQLEAERWMATKSGVTLP